MANQSRVEKPTSPSRRRTRLQKLADAVQQQIPPTKQLTPPSPSQSATDALQVSSKRKFSKCIGSDQGGEPGPKRQSTYDFSKAVDSTGDPVAAWVQTGYWPRFSEQRPCDMPRPATPTGERSSVNRGSSQSSAKKRRLQMVDNNVHFEFITSVHKESAELCEFLQQGDRRPTNTPGYPSDQVTEVLRRAQRRNEAHIQRDVTPMVCPSPEYLFLSGELQEEIICEEMQTLWHRCQAIAPTFPKPDVTIGLQSGAFTETEMKKLNNCATSSSGFFFTKNLYFPFLICEVKTIAVALDDADTQNLHSGSIAVRAVLRLFIAAYGREHQKVQDLLSRILVFTVSHNNRFATIYGHCAVAKEGVGATDEQFKYHRYQIADCVLGSPNPTQRFMAYNFVRNVYDHFAPGHIKRLKEAIAVLPEPEPEAGPDLTASSLRSGEEEQHLAADARTDTEGGAFKTSSEPASAMLGRELKEVKEQMEIMRREREEERKDHKEQMAQLLNTITALSGLQNKP